MAIPKDLEQLVGTGEDLEWALAGYKAAIAVHVKAIVERGYILGEEADYIRNALRRCYFPINEAVGRLDTIVFESLGHPDRRKDGDAA